MQDLHEEFANKTHMEQNKDEQGGFVSYVFHLRFNMFQLSTWMLRDKRFGERNV